MKLSSGAGGHDPAEREASSLGRQIKLCEIGERLGCSTGVIVSRLARLAPGMRSERTVTPHEEIDKRTNSIHKFSRVGRQSLPFRRLKYEHGYKVWYRLLLRSNLAFSGFHYGLGRALEVGYL